MALGMLAHPSGADTLRVQAATSLTNVVVRQSAEQAGELIVSSTLVDDKNQTIANAGLEAHLPPNARPRSCTSPRLLQLSEHTDDNGVIALLHTDSSGESCFRVSTALLGQTTELHFVGDDWHAGGMAKIALTRSLARVELDFAARQMQLRLDRESHRIRVITRPGRPAPPDGMPLPLGLLIEEEGKSRDLELSQTPSLGQSTVFDVPSTKLGSPGPAQLVVRYQGSDEASPEQAVLLVERTVLVRVQPMDDLPVGSPDTGMEIPVGVSSAAGPVPDGWIEARLGERVVGMAPVAAGTAAPTLRFKAQRAATVSLSLIYVPKEPWWLAPEPLTIKVDVRPPSPWRLSPWLLAAIALSYLVFRAWKRPKPALDQRATKKRPPRNHPEEIVVVQPGAPREGWSGRVIDAHEASPIAGARLQMLMASLSGESVRADVLTDEDGRFHLPNFEDARAEGSQLVVSAGWHRTRHSPIPPHGELEIPLVARRRALLERLVGWTRRQGPPWLIGREPTPRQVAGIAATRGDAHVERWASVVEEAVYGPAPVDELRDAQVRSHEPPA